MAKNFKMEKMEEIVIDLIKAHIRLYEEKETMIRKLNSSIKVVDMRNMYFKEKERVMSALGVNQNRKANIYNDFADGLLEETEYLILKDEYKKEQEELTNNLALLNETIDSLSPEYCADTTMKQFITDFNEFVELTADIINAFIKKIVVYDKEHIEVFYVFEDVFAKMDAVIEDRRRLLNGID